MNGFDSYHPDHSLNLLETKPWLGSDNITHPGIEATGASAEPISKLSGKSIVSVAHLHRGIEKTHSETLTTVHPPECALHDS
jgi:hypothetical protein